MLLSMEVLTLPRAWVARISLQHFWHCWNMHTQPNARCSEASCHVTVFDKLPEQANLTEARIKCNTSRQLQSMYLWLLTGCLHPLGSQRLKWGSADTNNQQVMLRKERKSTAAAAEQVMRM
jgi:hypothetical protein